MLVLKLFPKSLRSQKPLVFNFVVLLFVAFFHTVSNKPPVARFAPYETENRSRIDNLRGFALQIVRFQFRDPADIKEGDQ